MLLKDICIYALLYFYLIYGFFHFVYTIFGYLKFFGLKDVEVDIDEEGTTSLEGELDEVFNTCGVIQIGTKKAKKSVSA